MWNRHPVVVSISYKGNGHGWCVLRYGRGCHSYDRWRLLCQPELLTFFARNFSLAELIPKGSRLKQYIPKGVINVEYCLDSSVSVICQGYPLLKSNFEKNLDFTSLVRLPSIKAIKWISRWTGLFSFVRSTQRLIELFGFRIILW